MRWVSGNETNLQHRTRRLVPQEHNGSSTVQQLRDFLLYPWMSLYTLSEDRGLRVDTYVTLISRRGSELSCFTEVCLHCSSILKKKLE